MTSLHTTWGPIVAGFSGVVGVWGILMARRPRVPKAFYWAVGMAIATLLAQVLLGVTIMTTREVDPGNQHVFYGVVIAVTFAFTYIYRAQFRKRPALYYGVLLVFAMGLAIRGIATVGQSF